MAAKGDPMRFGGTHHHGCENATQHKCVCTQCEGALHGWPSRLSYVRESDGRSRAAFRARADQRWADAHNGHTKRKPSKRKKAAATDAAEADIVDWMAGELTSIAEARDITADEIGRGTPDQIVQTFGDIVANKVANELEHHLSSVSAGQRVNLTSHFWCDLLAAIACGMAKFKHELDKVPDYAIKAIIESRDSEGRAIDEFMIKLAVKTAWTAIKSLSLIPHQIDATLRAIQMLAIFICPATEDHQEVIMCCVDPLAKSGFEAVIKEETKKKLMQVLPPGWLSSP